jgi:hypothetical protein
MKTIYGVVLAAVFAGVASTASAGISSPAEAAAVCKAQAAQQYAAGEKLARVKFKGIYGGGNSRKVRMQILPAEGKAFLAVCELDADSGEVVSIAPANKAAARAVAVADPS